jgi:signal transduction histidine kinase/ActR/RegA family two-component response regulator
VIALVFISAIAAALCVGLGVTALAVDRIQGFRFMRWFAAIAFTAAAYSLVNASLFLNLELQPLIWLSRTGILLATLHAAAWLLLCRRALPAHRSRTQLALALVCAASGLTAMVPNWAYSSKTIYRTASLVQVTFRFPEITIWGSFVCLLIFLSLVYALLTVRLAERGKSGFWVFSIGVLIFIVAAAHEVAFVIGWVNTPLVASIGLLAIVIASGILFSQDVIENYSKLRELSAQLERDVDVRNQELIQAQIALTRADRLAALGQLAAGVGHEINNPLTYVMTNLRELSENLPAADTMSERVHLAGLANEALDGTERIRRVVRDLRLLSRARDQEQLESIDIHHVLGDALKLAEHVLKHRARVKEDYGDVPHVKAESQRLAQVFVNLLVNAAQAIPEDQPDRGTITVRTRRSATGRAVIEIADDGLGISPQHLGRIFEPYFTTKTQGEGTGLGLFVSLGIVRGFGGDIEVDSELGKGTTIRVYLPPSESVDEVEPTPSQLVPVAPRRARILVVDDEPVVARAMRRMLPNHEVSIVLDARHALSSFEQTGLYDVVVCDLMMPDISGADLYMQASDRWPDLRNRFLFITGGAVTPKAQELLQHPETRCLHKPVQSDELQAMVEAIVASVDRAQKSISSRPMW